MTIGVVEEEVADMQELNLHLAVNLHIFTAFTAFHRTIVHKICGEKINFSTLILYIFPIFS